VIAIPKKIPESGTADTYGFTFELGLGIALKLPVWDTL